MSDPLPPGGSFGRDDGADDLLGPCEDWPIEAAFRVRASLDVAEDHARRHGVAPPQAAAGAARSPHPSAPSVGTVATTTFTVAADDTAAAMGHPDAGMDVLGSPRLALWFELGSSPVMPDPDWGVRHVGVAILVHHLGMARVGDTVDVRVEVVAVDGRTVHLVCDARCDGDLVGSGSHQRVLVADGDVVWAGGDAIADG